MNFFKLFLINIFLIIFVFKNNAISSIKSEIIVKVGDEIITSFQLESKIKTTLLFAGEKLSQENINKVKNISLKFLINSKIKYNEIKNYKLDVNQVAINMHLENISKKLNIAPNNLKDFFNTKEMSYEQYIDEVKIEFMWQTLIRELYANRIVVQEDQINKEVDRIKKLKRNIQEFNLSEIEVDLENSLNKNDIINEIKNNIDKNGFESTALKFSTSSTAINGGVLGWINSNSLSQQIFEIIKNMTPGDISEPITKVNKIIFFKLIDKRVIQSKETISTDNLKKSLIKDRKREMLNLYSNNHLSKKRNSTLIEMQ